MSKYPSLPLFIDAYKADTAHLDDGEHGRYLLLLMLIWQSPECRIPNDISWLAHKLRRSKEDIERQIMPLVREFCQSTGNWITQKRLRKERSYVKKKSKLQSDRAKARWKKEKEICRLNAGGDAGFESDHHNPQKNNEKDVCHGNAPTPIPIIDSKNPPLSPPRKRAGAVSGDVKNGRGKEPRRAKGAALREAFLVIGDTETPPRTANPLSAIHEPGPGNGEGSSRGLDQSAEAIPLRHDRGGERRMAQRS